MAQDGFTRSELLRRGAVGFLAAPLLPRLLEHSAAPAGTQRFVSQPALQPPQLTVARGRTDDFVFLAPSSGPGQRGPMIVDGRGGLVWFKALQGPSAMDFKVQRYRGRPVLTWWEGRTLEGIPHGEWVVVDETYTELARFGPARGRNGDLHEFLITPENTALVACTEIVPWRHGKVVGGVVQELALPHGGLIREWRSLDHIPVDETAIRAKPGPRFDYFHLNSIDVDADGGLILSARNTWAAYKVDRTSGRLLWRLGGKKSSFALGPGARFWWQHDVRHHAGGVLSVFDNGASPAEERQSRALLLHLDTRRKRATLERAYVHTPQLVLSHFMGNTQLLPDGHVFVGWGGSPFVTEFAAGGSTVFDASLPRGGESYRAFRFPWTARPSAPPALAASGGTLYASWNGATDVAAWQLLEDGTATRRVDRTGFETALRPAAGTRSAVVAALDARGAELGRSAAVRP